jgi:translation initiation factor IF-3
LRRSRPPPRKPEKRLRVNDMIRAREVRVIDDAGAQLGVMVVAEALRVAQGRGLDLIEVAPQAEPPVCRIMDYGKFRFEQRKKERESQKKSRQIELKTIRVRPNTDDHDIDFKARHARKFLEKGHKVKFNVIFRGPEMRHTDIGRRQLQLFTEKCADISEVDQSPRMEARNMTLILTPKAEVLERAQAERRAAGEEGHEEHGEAEGKDAEVSRETVQGHGDRPPAPQEDGAQPSPVG